MGEKILRKKLKLLNDCKIPFLAMIVKHKRDIDGKFNVFNELPAEKFGCFAKNRRYFNIISK